jgi:hypothetical protein
LVPEGKPGANTTRAQLARLIGWTGAYRTASVVRAELGAHHYRLQFLDIDGVSSDGWYTLINLPPGDYRLVAVADVEPGRWYDGSFLRTLGGFRTLTLADGGRLTQDIIR